MSGQANRGRYLARVSKTGAAVGLGVALLAGCAAGQHAQTSEEKSVIDGVNVSSGSISLDDVSVTSPSNGSGYAAGDDAPLQLVIVNSGTTPDTLTSVTVDPSVAKSVSISLSGAGVSDSDIPTGVSGSIVGPSPTPTPDSNDLSGAPSSSGSTDASASPSSSGSDVVPIPVPVGDSVRVGLSGADASIVLNDLAKPLYPAQNITLVFTFSNGETISALTNVHLGTDDSGGPTLAIEPSSDT